MNTYEQDSKNIDARKALAFDLVNAAGYLERRLDRALSGVRGISFSEYRLLRELAARPEARAMRVELAQAVGLTPSAVTRALKPMEKLGLIEIYPGASASPSVLIDEPANTVEVSVATDPNFLYQLFSSGDLTSWAPVHPDKITGDGNPLEIVTGPVGARTFYRWLICPGF